MLGDRVKATSLAALAGGGKVEGSKSDQAIVVGGGLAGMPASNTVFVFDEGNKRNQRSEHENAA